MEHISKVVEDMASSRPARSVPTASHALDDGTLLEMIYDAAEHRAAYIHAKDGDWREVPDFTLPDGRRLVPYSPQNNLLTHGVVLFPSKPEEYGTKKDLLGAIQSFIHRYVDLSPVFERVAAHYVLLSWTYDHHEEMPYLRVRGDPGSGKTRFLLTVGSLAYKPIFASGASTVSPLFRLLDSFRGTLVLDEADFRFSDERVEIVKILNNGTTRGFPVLRSEATPGSKEYNPRAFHVFGPKLVATRNPFEDPALESRFLTEDMGARSLREDVPIALSPSHREEALHLRNQLLLFRLRNHGRKGVPTAHDRSLSPRLNQMFGPLLSVIDDEETRREVLFLARGFHRDQREDRSHSREAQVLAVIRNCVVTLEGFPSIGSIVTALLASAPNGSFPSLTPRTVGYLVRKKLGLATLRTRDGYVIASGEVEKLPRLLDHYGLSPLTPGDEALPPSSRSSPSTPAQQE